jgi:hypothetical protein
MYYALVFDRNGNGIGSHAYVEEPSSYPDNEIVCTQDQAQNPGLYQIVNGTVTESLTAAQSVQTTLIQNACIAAQTAPLTFTTQGGVTKTFPMDLQSQSNLRGAVLSYVLMGESFPTEFVWKATDGTYVPFTVADLKALGSLLTIQVQTAWAKEQALLTEIASATTVSAVQAITF